MPLSWRPMLNVLSVLTPDVSLHRCPPASSPTGRLTLGSLLTSVLLVFTHIKSCIVDCLLPTPVNSVWFFCCFPSCLVLSFLGRQSLLSQGLYRNFAFPTVMKNKDIRSGSATKCEPSSGIGSDPFIITLFRAAGSSPMGLVSLQYTFVKVVVGQHFSLIRTQIKAIISIMLYRERALYSL